MSLGQQIQDFLSSRAFAVVGASSSRDKYGNKVFRVFLQKKYDVVPVNPNAAEVEGCPAVVSLEKIPEVPHSIAIITPPAVTEQIVQQAIGIGVKHIWMQPGAESDHAIQLCEDAGINVIHSGPCLLVVLGFRDSAST